MKKLGQHYLLDEIILGMSVVKFNIYDDAEQIATIVDAKDKMAIEIGPGTFDSMEAANFFRNGNANSSCFRASQTKAAGVGGKGPALCFASKGMTFGNVSM